MPATAKKKNGLFAKIENGADAAKTVRDASLAFFVVAVLYGLMGVFMARAAITDAVILLILATILMKWRSRAAAVLLLLMSGLQAGVTLLNRLGMMSEGGNNVFLAAIMVITAARAVEATFKLHGRYRSQLASST
jgi:hypothetical protein